jgi:hypothetical protein
LNLPTLTSFLDTGFNGEQHNVECLTDDMTALLLDTLEKSSTACNSSTGEETFGEHRATIAQKVAVAAKKAVEAYTDVELGFSPPTRYYTGPPLFEVDMKRFGLSFEEQE